MCIRDRKITASLAVGRKVEEYCVVGVETTTKEVDRIMNLSCACSSNTKITSLPFAKDDVDNAFTNAQQVLKLCQSCSLARYVSEFATRRFVNSPSSRFPATLWKLFEQPTSICVPDLIINSMRESFHIPQRCKARSW